MATKQSGTILFVDGHEISVSFSDTKNIAVINQVKQILLSSFVASTSRPLSNGILAICPTVGDTCGGSTPYAP